MTGSIVCTLLQFAYNEIGIFRVKYVSQVLSDAPTPSSPLSSHKSSAHETLPTQPRTHEQNTSNSLLDRMFDWIGFHKVADDEYLKKLIQQRDGHLRRIAELERILEEEGNEKPKP